jgi:hypothetical protein
MDWKARAEAILGDEDDYTNLTAKNAAVLALVNERLDAEGLRNKVWMVMPYSCDKCRSQVWYEAEYGVEGPRAWRDDVTYIASSFTAGLCTRCGGTLTHVMGRDVKFEHPVEPGERFFPPGSGVIWSVADKFFRVPREPVVYATEGCDDDGNVIYGDPSAHAFLSTPMHAITRGMKREAEPFA